ncbi:MAG: helix-turn-helix domain-containing protein [Robiginitomaculum sp.]|nr:helix-turn-helix domain-containing protein [Robiginitomaculum sp.]
MIDNQTSGEKPVFLNAKQAAEFLGLKPNTLAKMRVYGNGPEYRKHGQRVLYSLDDLTTWSDASRRSSTSEVPDV